MRQIKWYKWSVHGTELAINITISLASVAEWAMSWYVNE